MFFFPGPFQQHRLTGDGKRDQSSIERSVVCAVMTVTSGTGHKRHLDCVNGHVQGFGDCTAQWVNPLRVCVNRQQIVFINCTSGGRSNRAVHEVGFFKDTVERDCGFFGWFSQRGYRLFNRDTALCHRQTHLRV